MMIFMDPPQHTRYRKLVSRAFTPRHMAALEPRIRDAGDGVPRRVRRRRRLRLRRRLRRPACRSWSISALLGAPEEDEEQLREWTDATLHIEPGEMMGDARAIDHSQSDSRLLAGAHRRAPPHAARRHHERADGGRARTKTTARPATSPTTSSTASWACSRARGTRPSPASSVGRRPGSTSFPTQRAQAGRRSGADPERGRRDPALGGAVGDPGSLGHERRSSCTDTVLPDGLQGRAAHRRREPRRAHVRRSRRDRRRARDHPPRRVRIRRSTSVSAPRWPGSKAASRSRRRSSASRRGTVDRDNCEMVHTEHRARLRQGADIRSGDAAARGSCGSRSTRRAQLRARDSCISPRA